MSVPSSPLEPRVRAARWVLHGAGVFALVLFFAMPLVEAGPFASAIVRPAYGLAPVPRPLAPDTLEPHQRAVLEALAGGEALGDRAVMPETFDALTPVETVALGLRLSDDAARLGPFARQTRILGRFLALAAAMYAVLGGLGLVLPLWRGPQFVPVNAAVSIGSLMLLATHVVTVGVDLVELPGAAGQALFAWPSHALTVPLMLALALGTMLPLTVRSALRVLVLSLGGLALVALGCGLWIVL